MNQQVSVPEPGQSPELAATDREISELRDALAAAEAREGLLRHELQHRVRNVLAVIRSVYRRSRESGAGPEEFADHFQGRLDALARYQSLVDDLEGPGIELEDMLRDELLATCYLDGPNCTISGPPVFLRHKAAELMGLTIHELTTNAIKFGAFAQGGKLAVKWSVTPSQKASLLHFCWSETDVSVVASAPRPHGFGRQLIEEALPYQLGATTSFDLGPGGLECSIVLPLTPSNDSPDGQVEAGADESPLLPSQSESLR